MLYSFGGDTGITYEQLQQRRKMTERLRNQNSRTPRNAGEGIHAIARALVARGVDKQNTARAQELKEQYSGLWDNLLGASGGGYASSGATGQTAGSFAPIEPSAEDQYELSMGRPEGTGPERETARGANPIVDPSLDADTWGGLVAGNAELDMGRDIDTGSQLMSDLQRDFGLTKEQTAGVVGNLAHESGDFKTLQEVSPVVPGSRGGFGFAQWTGPRRRQFEAWAQKNNLDPKSYEANYGFLKHELQNTPEGRVLDDLRQAQGVQDATRIFSDKFLRPGIPHMDSRMQRAARFAGGEYTPSQQGGSGGVRTAQAGGFDPSVIQLAQMLNAPDEFVPLGQKSVVQALLGQKLAQNKPMTPLQQQQYQMNQIKMEQMQQPQSPEVVDINGVAATWDTDQGQYVPVEGFDNSDGGAIDVQSSVILDDGTSVLVSKDGRRVVRAPDGGIVEGQAAADAIKAAREYTTQNQRDIYSARRTGTNTAEAQTGGAAAAAKSIGGKQGQFVEDAFKGADAVAGSIGNINTAIAALDAGARSGAIDRYIPNITEASATLQNAMDRMGLDVIGSVTFGALSEAELRLAMETAVPRNLNEEELRNWLMKKRDSQQKVRVALIEQARFLSDPNNSLKNWADQLEGEKAQGDEPDDELSAEERKYLGID